MEGELEVDGDEGERVGMAMYGDEVGKRAYVVVINDEGRNVAW